MKLQKIPHKPDKWKPLAIVFTVLAIANVVQLFKFQNSSDPAIADYKTEIIIGSTISAIIFLFLAIWFWRKSAKTKRI